MSSIDTLVNIHRSKIIELSKKYGMLEPRIFGSVAKGKDDPQDLDIFVHAEKGRSYFDLIDYND
jgi:predicted nucleotidyltransferase